MLKRYQYFVEGECEQKLINILKDIQNQYIVPGKVKVFNIQQDVLTNYHLMLLKPKTTIIFVFDTDKVNENIYKNNILLLNKNGFKDIIMIKQEKNLENELIKSTDIKQIKELLNSKSNKDFKRDFIKENNLMKKLIDHSFNINKLWLNMNKKDRKRILFYD